MKKAVIFLVLVMLFPAYSQISTASKQVTTFTISAPQLETIKKIWLYLPIDYSKSNDKKYSVIYMHDAQNLFDKSTAYAGEWRIDELMDSIKAKVIIVGIEHGNDKRMDELTPFSNLKYGGGKGDLYLDFIVSTLKPYVDSTYRTKKDPTNTIIFGSSLGGLISFYALLKYPNVFGKAGVFSPSYWFNRKEIFDLMEKQRNLKVKFIFFVGIVKETQI